MVSRGWTFLVEFSAGEMRRTGANDNWIWYFTLLAEFSAIIYFYSTWKVKWTTVDGICTRCSSEALAIYGICSRNKKYVEFDRINKRVNLNFREQSIMIRWFSQVMSMLPFILPCRRPNGSSDWWWWEARLGNMHMTCGQPINRCPLCVVSHLAVAVKSVRMIFSCPESSNYAKPFVYASIGHVEWR